METKNSIRPYGRHKLNKEYFKTINTEEKAYWLGFLMADGCVYKGASANSYRLQINLQESDKNILEKFNKALESDYSIITKEIYNKKTDKTYKTAMLKINNTDLCLDLIKHNIVPRKTFNCKFPNISKELYRHFIRGYFDGDGCITSYLNNQKGRYTFAGTESLLTSFQNILKEANIESHIYKVKNKEIFELTSSSIPEIIKFYNFLYNNATVYLERKHNKFIEFLSPHLATNDEKNSN